MVLVVLVMLVVVLVVSVVQVVLMAAIVVVAVAGVVVCVVVFIVVVVVVCIINQYYNYHNNKTTAFCSPGPGSCRPPPGMGVGSNPPATLLVTLPSRCCSARVSRVATYSHLPKRLLPGSMHAW